MRFSRLSLFIILTTVLIGTNCAYYNRILTRKNLVDGANAYKNRKFGEAERLFREAVSRDPEGATLEGKAAQLFLARTIHSEFIGNRKETERADQAIREYQRALAIDPKDQSSFKAVANLYENLNKDDEWLKWVTERANNEQIPNEQRSEAFTSLAAKKNTCANDISDTEATKKTVTKDGKQVFEFVKPANPADLQALQQCSTEGLELAKKAVELDQNSDSAYSYLTSLLIQNMRLAEMEGRKEDEAKFKAESDTAKEKFTVLADARRQKEQAEAERKKAEEEAAAAAANKKK
jgi:tetratricopeptide (TPR) repeat protein